MIQPERIRAINDRPARDGKYVLYWMQAAQRVEYNHALEYAVRSANDMRKPVVVYFGITDNWPEANLRHYHFMLEGLREVRHALEAKGIQMVIRHQSPDSGAAELAKEAAMVVVDAGHLRVQAKWRANAAGRIECPMYEVETNLIVPVEEASTKENFSAGTFRPRITKQLDRYLVPLKRGKPRVESLDMKFSTFDIEDIDKALSKIDIGRSVPKSDFFQGGTSEAKKRLDGFLRKKLDRFGELRNDPTADHISNMSPYLHFGQISPLFIALKVLKNRGAGRDANAFAGVNWRFGKHDRAWAERPIFGKIRYMNAAGLKRKFNIEAYVKKVRELK